MLVHQRTLLRWETQHVARVPHGQRQCARLSRIETAEIDRHKKCGHLIVRNLSPCACRDNLFDLRRQKRLALTFRFDQWQKMHRRKLANAEAKAILKPWL